VNQVSYMVKKAKAAGSFIGALFNNPTFLIIGALGITLFIFKDKIGEFFGGLKFPEIPPIELPTINLPTINLPEINFPDFPEIKFPDFSDIFSGFQSQLSSIAGDIVELQGREVIIPPDTTINPDGTVSSTTPPISTGGGATQQEQDFAQARASAFDTLFDLDVLTGTQIQQAISNIDFGDTAALNALIVSIQSLASDQAQEGGGMLQEGGFDVPFNDPLGIGGGGSFIGGTTTFGDQSNIVDTLSEVLNIFPNLTASQAADALAENVGLTPNEFAQTDPDIINISSAGVDPDQIINNASGGFSGLTPEQIANILTGGNISNF